MSAAATSASVSAARAPASNPCVISGLKLETTIAKRHPAAVWAPRSSSATSP
jgi:hypothetical protein